MEHTMMSVMVSVIPVDITCWGSIPKITEIVNSEISQKAAIATETEIENMETSGNSPVWNVFEGFNK